MKSDPQGSSSSDKHMTRCIKCAKFFPNDNFCIHEYSQNNDFICPFCAKKNIKCLCKENTNYKYEIIECQTCHNYVHKKCYKLGIGRNPPDFKCIECGGKTEFHLKTIRFDPDTKIKDLNIIPEDANVLDSLPKGGFHKLLEEEYQMPSIHFKHLLEHFFTEFAPILLERDVKFWNTFVFSISELFEIVPSLVMGAVDELASNFIYSDSEMKYSTTTSHLTNKATLFIKDIKLESIETIKSRISWRKDGAKATSAIKDKELICAIPGLILHISEVDTTSGVPRSIVKIPDTPLAIIPHPNLFPVSLMKRSFHYNCSVNLRLLMGSPVVCMYGHFSKGPLSQLRTSDPAIASGGELVLPLDGGLPYPVRSLAWDKNKEIVTMPVLEVPEEIPEPPVEEMKPKPPRKGRDHRHPDGHKIQPKSSRKATLMKPYVT